jgi:membrane fusion protein (multidrug efflux system)
MPSLHIPAAQAAHRVFTRRWPALLAAAALLAGCGGGSAPGGAPGAGGAPPPPPVGVLTVALQPVALQAELPGRVEALRVAQVRARVNGVVQQRLFTEGSEVRAGQPLFRIDAAPYQAALESAQAALARAEANLAQATATAERYQPLAEAKAISQQDYANAAAAQKTAAADVAAGRAAVLTARINLGYAQVTAPIAGRIGRALVTEGALVSAAEATPLALVQQVGSVYVNFTQSSAEVLRLRRALASGQLRKAGAGAPTVRVVLEDGSELPQAGRLLFSDLNVDASSGQVTLRAEVPNPDGLLLPGQYVRVRLAQAELPAAVRVPQQAVTRTAQGDTVLVVGEGNKPGPRTVQVAGALGGDWVVTGGLQPGERVIVDGFQKMFVPGAPVSPVPWQPGASGPTPGAAGPAAPSAAASAPAPAPAASR